MTRDGAMRDIRRTLESLFEPGDVFEVRVVNSKQRTRSGYFTLGDAALKAIAREDAAGPPAVYITLNPCNPALRARAYDRIRGYAVTTTGDRDIACRRNLLIDADPVRPKGISATDAEHEIARDRIKEMTRFLKCEFRITPVLIADSGNGWHAILAIDLPNDRESATLCEEVLNALDYMFSDDRVKIDMAVANAARIVKCYGTLVRKGDDTLDRPHRRSAIAFANGRISVSRNTLEAIAGLLPHETSRRKAKGDHDPFDVAQFLARNFIAVRRESEWNGGRRWILVACVFDASHGGSSSAIIQHASGALSYKCLHNSCAKKTWADVRELFEPGYRQRSCADDTDRGHATKGAAKPPADDAKTRRQAEVLLAQAQKAGINFVHDDRGKSYALIREAGQDGHKVFDVGSSRFRAFLARLYYKQNGKPASRAVLTDVIAVMEGIALYDGDRVEIHLRYRATAESICIDLGDSNYQMIFVTADGWGIVPHGDVLFRRPPALLAIPKPISDGTKLDKLRQFIHADGENFLRILIWIVCAMRGRGPFPILPLHGEQGSTKTTAEKILKALIDPSKVDARAPCRDTHDLAIAADSSYVLAFDNLSDFSPAIADAFCRLSTGGSFTTRTLYSDRDEEIFDGERPLVLTSIEDLMARPDLADRAIPAQLAPVPDEDRIPEAELWEAFWEVQPALLGSLLDALVVALKKLPEVRASAKKLPRMADAFLFSLAAESALRSGKDSPTVEDAWRHTREEAVASALESSLIAGPFLRLLASQLPNPNDIWEVTAGQVLRRLNSPEFTPDPVRAQRGWPSNGKSLINKLRRISPALRAYGYTFSPVPRSAKSRTFAFSRVIEEQPLGHRNPAESSFPSSSSLVEHGDPSPCDGGDANDETGTPSDPRPAVL